MQPPLNWDLGGTASAPLDGHRTIPAESVEMVLYRVRYNRHYRILFSWHASPHAAIAWSEHEQAAHCDEYVSPLPPMAVEGFDLTLSLTGVLDFLNAHATRDECPPDHTPRT